MGQISLGTMIRGGEKTSRAISRFIPAGIESLQIFFWGDIPASSDFRWMEAIVRQCGESAISVSALGLFMDPFSEEGGEARAADSWNRLVDMAVEFHIPLVSGFTGRIPGVSAESSLPAVKSFFSPLVDRCLAGNLKLAFENCPMEGHREGGGWNIAFLPEIWERLFYELFPVENVGLEFDPSHCIRLGQPVLELAERWLPKIYHVHGKDAAPESPFEFRFPGEGCIDWPALLGILKSGGYRGSVDLEGYHSMFVSHEAEVENQKKSLAYLRQASSS